MKSNSGKNDPIEEYLFVDYIRLGTYLEQIGSSIDFITPALTAEMGLAGWAKIALDGSKLKSNLKHNLLDLENYLRDANQLDYERSLWDDKEGKRFCIEECTARKILFPNAKSLVPGIKGLTLWISLKPKMRKEYIGPLYLIEYYPYDETDPSPYSPLNSMSGMSGYTAYRYLLDRLNTSSRKLLNDCLSIEAKRDPEASFANDPFECWNSSELIIGDVRKIKSMYRRRTTLFEKNANILSTFGYPIYISEGSF